MMRGSAFSGNIETAVISKTYEYLSVVTIKLFFYFYIKFWWHNDTLVVIVFLFKKHSNPYLVSYLLSSVTGVRPPLGSRAEI
jgi:uncharacterized integral membrane protein